MSLTSFVDEPANRLYLLSKLPIPNRPTKVPIIAPPLTKNYGTIGTAFDYMARFNIKRNYPQALDTEWLAESTWRAIARRTRFAGPPEQFLPGQPGEAAVRNAALIEEQKNFVLQGAQALVDAKARYTAYLKGKGNLTDVASSCMDLAYMDVVYRVGIYPRKPLGQNDPLDLQDLVALHERLPQPFPGPHKEIHLNPTFGVWSSRIGGADADYIADETLIDIKTTKNLELKPEWWLQLVGYALLDDLLADDEEREPRIRNVSIYYSRHGGYWATSLEPFRSGTRWREALTWLRLQLLEE